MKINRIFFLPTLFVALAIATSGCGEPLTFSGEIRQMGEGTAYTYVELNPDGSPVAMGVAFAESLLKGLPTAPNNTDRCFDADGNGAFDAGRECVGDYERILPLSEALLGVLVPGGSLAKRSDIPFQWVSLNWYPEGHPPPTPTSWAKPHFGFYFYVASQEVVQQIRPGTCGELIDCEDFERAKIPPLAQYLPEDYIDVGAAVPAMGNHLINSTSPEFIDPSQKFTHTFIYGAYDGHITFYEPMITREFLMTRPNECVLLKLPQAWEVSGYYPTEYCMRYLESQGEYTVSLESFVPREAE